MIIKKEYLQPTIEMVSQDLEDHLLEASPSDIEIAGMDGEIFEFGDEDNKDLDPWKYAW